MYSVFANDLCIYNDMYIDEGHRVINPVLNLADNSAGSFTVTLPPTNVGFDIIKHLSTKIIVKRDNIEIWEGRVISENRDFWNRRSITCEGELAYLNDTIQPPAEYHNLTIYSFLTTMIEIHNSKVPSDKQFTVGIVTVTDDFAEETEGNLYRYTNYESTMQCIKEKLMDRFEGHLRIRKVNGVRYLDYLKDYPDTNNQIFRFGKNLIDFTKNWDLTDLATVIIPRGKMLEESSIEALTAYTTIESVNNGSIYYANQDAVNEFGRIEIVVDWSDVSEPNNLFTKAKKYLSEYQFDKMIIELNALDMHYISKNEAPINLLERVRCISKPHGLDKYFPVTEINIYLDEPDKTTYKLGDSEVPSLSVSLNSSNNELLNQIKNLPTKQVILRQAKEKATNMIHNATHGYVVLNYDDNGAFEILVMNTNNVNTATKVWRWNMGGFGYSPNGYAGPYEVAMTMDGSIVADFITTGTMFANRIKGGQLVMGGYDNENGVINVNNSEGKTVITIDCNGINVNNNFTVDTQGNIKAFSIGGNALSQFSNAIDNSEAMSLAKQAITDAANAASAAKKTAGDVEIHVNNINETIIPEINGEISKLQVRVANLEAK